MRGLGSGSFDPKTLAILEAAFDEAWLTLKCNGIEKGGANELAPCFLHFAPGGHATNEQPSSALAATADPMKCRGAARQQKSFHAARHVRRVREHDRPV